MSVLSFPVSTSHLILKSNPIFLHLFKNLFYLNSTFSSGGELKYNSSCALLDNGAVKCWGYNAHGQLGIGNTDTMGDGSGEMAALTSIDLGTGRTSTSIATGYWHNCALLDDASVKCWGGGTYGQLGIENGGAFEGDDPGEMAALPSINL